MQFKTPDQTCFQLSEASHFQAILSLHDSAMGRSEGQQEYCATESLFLTQYIHGFASIELAYFLVFQTQGNRGAKKFVDLHCGWT
jgi:hypothetical protein